VGILSASFAPQIHLIMARSFLRSRCRSEAFGAQVSLNVKENVLT